MNKHSALLLFSLFLSFDARSDDLSSQREGQRVKTVLRTLESALKKRFADVDGATYKPMPVSKNDLFPQYGFPLPATYDVNFKDLGQGRLSYCLRVPAANLVEWQSLMAYSFGESWKVTDSQCNPYFSQPLIPTFPAYFYVGRVVNAGKVLLTNIGDENILLNDRKSSGITKPIYIHVNDQNTTAGTEVLYNFSLRESIISGLKISEVQIVGDFSAEFTCGSIDGGLPCDFSLKFIVGSNYRGAPQMGNIFIKLSNGKILRFPIVASSK